MGLIKSIREFLKDKQVPEEAIEKVVADEQAGKSTVADGASDTQMGIDFLDGMSTGTARFIIDKKVSDDVLEKYEVADLENKGRYYLAKIVDSEGNVTDTVLIDKVNRTVHFQKGKFK